MPEQKVRTELDGGVLTIILDDDANRNALSTTLMAQFGDAVQRANSDAAVRVVVVTNSGRVFCAGADLSERTAEGERPSADLGAFFRLVTTSPKPFVGRIAGHAVAGGLGLAAAMDLSVGLVDAKFGFTEVRIGVAPAVISVMCLPKMRRADAASALLRGNRFDGTEAARLGLINQAVEPGSLDEATGAIVDDLLRGGPNALDATKSLLSRVPQLPTDEAFTWTAELSARLFDAPEAQEGMTAYLEKRDPSWIGQAGTGAGTP
ncbi:MAG: enoyl-CoA hydratase-related protein [Microthrixaceae bacterium]